ncbi:translation initiation factor III [Actinoplanes sp. NPDC049265]|uniref:translation initiation factor III n=1 Tax=Actinoplanes sp. NPDC049265 TaxID=3363902 RepID=UPI00372178E0
MARTRYNERPDNRPEPVAVDATGGRKPPPKWSVAVLAICILTAVWAASMLTPFGRVGYYYFFAYSEFYMGVLTLVSLSITIMVGLVSTDRLVLSIRQRVLLQSAHRTTGVIAVTSLVAHVWTKFMEEHIGLIDFIPILSSFNNFYVGLGTLSGWVLLLVTWTGLARARFIGRGKPWMWRSIHSISYLMWPLALIHGLGAGRPAATWVTVSYIVCVLGVLIGLAVRLSVSLNRKKDFSSTSTGSMKPVGAVVPTAAAPAPRRKRREEPEPPSVETFKPATPRPPVMAPPASGMPASGMPASAMPASGMPSSSMPISSNPISPMPYDDEGYGRRGGRRRADERYDEPTGAMSRRAMESYDEPTGQMSRRGREYYDEPTGQMSRRAIEDERYRYEDEAPRRRRYADDDDDRYDDAPRGRRGDYRTGEFETYDAPRRSRREGRDDVDRADSGRHSRSEFVDLAPQSEGWRGRSDPNFMEPDETPTLVDMASRRARRQAQQAEPIRPRGGRRDRVSGGDESLDDAQYWRQLRGEAR